MLGVVSVSFVALNMKVHAVNTISSGDYALSCTNAAYGTQNGSAYIDERDADKSYGMYTGEDCVYSGAGRTNSSVIVGGELARAAANSIIGSVSGRLSSAFGYAQVIDSTWEWYKDSTNNRYASRTSFRDSTDFVGWYINQSNKKLKLRKNDVYNHYLAYHQGHQGFATEY